MRPRRRCARTASPWGGDVPLDLELVFHQRTKLLEDLGGAGFPGQGRSPLGGLFGPAEPNTDEPGNYWILDYAPDYSWAIVGDPNGTAGYILTREQEISDTEYDALVARAYELGVKRTIIRTRQFPDPAPVGVLPGPGTLPATIRV